MVIIQLASFNDPTAVVMKTTTLSPEEGSAYAAEVDESIENSLVAISECDFDMHIRGSAPETWEGRLGDDSTFLQE